MLVLAAATLAAPAGAEIVLMTNGAWLKVAGYELLADAPRVRLSLPGGGALVVPLAAIERVLDDEIAPAAWTLDPGAGNADFPLRFRGAPEVPAVPYGELIYQTARRHRLNPALVAAVAAAESAFKQHAVSPQGAQGLMQLMPATAERFGLAGHERFDPARNLDAGSRYLSWLIDRFGGDLTLVLAGYNAGEGTVDRFGGVPPYRETRSYIARIFERLGLEPSGFDPAGRGAPGAGASAP